MFWKEKNVLVTGADGFAGYHLCNTLVKQGANLRAFVKPGVINNLTNLKGIEIIKGDVQDYQSLVSVMQNVDVIFHLAAITVIPETRAVMANTFAVNSTGTLNLLMAAKEKNVKKINYVSTCHVYGKQDNLPIKENYIPQPFDIYSASKYSAELLCLSFVEMFKMDISISRAFNHFGPKQRYEFLIPTIIRKILQHEDLTLGNPNPTRDFSFVSDITDGYLLLAEYGKAGEVYHFCSGIERTIKSIADDIIEIGNFDVEFKWNPNARKIDLSRSYGDNTKSKKDLGWTPKISFKEGIDKTISFFNK